MSSDVQGASRPADDQPPVLDIAGESTQPAELFRGLRRHWRLMPVLARQDFAARYRSASLGLAWSVFVPLLQAAVLAVVFRHIVRIDTHGLNYPVFVLAGMVTWSYFNGSVTTGSTAITETSALASRVYFPRLMLPAMPAAANLASYCISIVVLLLLMVVEGSAFHWQLILLPAVVALATLLAVGFAAVAAILHVFFRDTRYVVLAGNIPWFYATPVIYPLELAHRLRPVLLANPATGLVQATRWMVFGHATDTAVAVVVTLGWTVGLLGIAVLAYCRYDRVAADRL